MQKISLALMLMVFISCNSNPKKSPLISENNDSLANNNTGQSPRHTGTLFTLNSFNKNDVPMKDIVKSEIVDGASWTDAEGEHMVILVQTANKMINGKQNQHINAYCYKKDSDAWKQTWQVQDRIEDCEVDATCEFFPGSLTVTDKDKNDVGEVTFLYKLSCKGDVSPDDKKLIMYEGSQKYAIRGVAVIELDGQRQGGDKKPDPSFTNGAKPLLDFANEQWDKFGYTKY